MNLYQVLNQNFQDKPNHHRNYFHYKMIVQKNDYNLTDVTRLEGGDYTTVAPGEWHWFETRTMVVRRQTEVLEIYYLEPISADIIRKTVGGIVE